MAKKKKVAKKKKAAKKKKKQSFVTKNNLSLLGAIWAPADSGLKNILSTFGFQSAFLAPQFSSSGQAKKTDCYKAKSP